MSIVLDHVSKWFGSHAALDEVSLDMAVACQEVFGPVVTVARVSGLDEAIEKANGTDYGLQAGVFTSDLSKAMRAARSEFNGPRAMTSERFSPSRYSIAM